MWYNKILSMTQILYLIINLLILYKLYHKVGFSLLYLFNVHGILIISNVQTMFIWD